MSSNSPEAQDLLRLFKCVVDTGADVLVPFTEHKLLKSYNRNFEKFLDDKKHEIFHLWQSKRLLCCKCPPAGCILKRTGHMDNWIFKKLYDDKGNEDGGHIVRNSGKVVQVCLHKYITRTIGIDELDISALSFLLRHLATLSTNETTALDTITTYRGLICHAQSSNCYDKASLNIIWTGLENALVELTDPSYKRLTKKQIKCLRKVHLEKEEIQELLKTVEESIEEVTKLLSSNNNVIEKCELNLKKTVVEESLAMQHRLEDESSSIKQTQQVVIQEVLSSKAAAQESGNKILEQIEMLNRNQASIFTAMSDQREMIMKMVHPINGTTFSIKCEQSTDLSDGSKVCFLLWQLATPEHWNAAEVEQILTKCEDMFKDLPIKIKFVRKGSLVIMTTVAVEVLKNSPAFQSAIKSFLTRMVEVCNINTHVNCDVDVTLHVLNINELNCKPSNIPTENKVVQTEDTDYEHQMRMTKHWNESEIFDLAFLNSDNQTEIEWIQNVSSMLKAKYDIKCAIPSKDYLYGLPLKDELLQYLNKFPAVVLTVTKENHHFYQPYFDDKTPLIVVELDYISEIPRKLWTFPYINCTTCEHLWVPQLINTLKTKLPNHVKRRIENVQDEQEVNCVKCKSATKTAVYHTVGIKQDRRLRIVFVTLCGSLTDETWILNLLNQSTELIRQYNFLGWYKSLDSIIREEPSFELFVCVSPNVQTCPSIGDYVNSLGKNKTTTVHLLKIAQAEIPRFLCHLPHLIDATTTDINVLAHKLFSPIIEHHYSGVNITLEMTNISWERDDNGDEIESSKKANVSLEKEHYGGVNDRLEEANSSLERDDNGDEIDSSKKANVSLEKDHYGAVNDWLEKANIGWKTDDNGDDIDQQKKANKSMDKGNYRRLIDVDDDDIKSQKRAYSKKNVQRFFWRPDEDGDDIDRQKRANKSMDKGFSWRPDSIGDNIERRKMANKSMDKDFSWRPEKEDKITVSNATCGVSAMLDTGWQFRSEEKLSKTNVLKTIEEAQSC